MNWIKLVHLEMKVVFGNCNNFSQHLEETDKKTSKNGEIYSDFGQYRLFFLYLINVL